MSQLNFSDGIKLIKARFHDLKDFIKRFKLLVTLSNQNNKHLKFSDFNIQKLYSNYIYRKIKLMTFLENEMNNLNSNKDLYNTKFIKSIYFKHKIVDQRINDISRSSNKGLMRNSSEEFLKRYEEFNSINISHIQLQMKKDYYSDSSNKLSFLFNEKIPKSSYKLDKKEFLKVLVDYEQSEDKNTNKVKVNNLSIICNDNKKYFEKKYLVINKNISRNMIVSHTTKNSFGRDKVTLNISKNETEKNKNSKPLYPKYCKIDLNLKEKKRETVKGKNNLDVKYTLNVNSRNSKPSIIYSTNNNPKTNSQRLKSKMISFKSNYSYNIKDSILMNSQMDSKIVSSLSKNDKVVDSINNSKNKLRIGLRKNTKLNLNSPKREI